MDTDQEDDFNAKSGTFLAWLKQRGATISPKIQLADLREQNAGRGVVAKASLAEDEELFSIPRSLILTLDTSSIPEQARQTFRDGTDDSWLLLILTMVLENIQGGSSSWKPYFDVLPADFDTLMFWNDQELDELKGSAVLDKIGKAGANATFQERLLPLLRSAATAVQTSDLPSDDELLSLCHRMGSTIMAYAFDLEKTSDETKTEQDEWEEDEEVGESLPKGMVPLADMLNAEGDRNNAKLFYEDDKVVMKTIKPVDAGEELYNDFGLLPRADLLRRYGYVTNNYAKYDVVEIATPLIRELAKVQLRVDDKDLEDRWAYLEEQGVLDDAYDVFRAGSEEGQFPEELCILLNLLMISEAEFDKLRKKDKLPKADLTNEAKALLRSVLVHRYAQYPPDSDVSAQDSDAHRRAMARQVVQGEKVVIREAIDAIAGLDPAKKKRGVDTLDEEATAIRMPRKK